MITSFAVIALSNMKVPEAGVEVKEFNVNESEGIKPGIHIESPGFQAGGRAGRAPVLRLRRQLFHPAKGTVTTIAESKAGTSRERSAHAHYNSKYRLPDAFAKRHRPAGEALDRVVGMRYQSPESQTPSTVNTTTGFAAKTGTSFPDNTYFRIRA